MKKIFCDACGSPMSATFLPGPVEVPVKLEGTEQAPILLSIVPVLHDYDICKHCVLDALKKLDDRPPAFAMPVAGSTLRAVLRAVREDAMRECWEAVNALITPGLLPGNGTDKAAERN